MRRMSKTWWGVEFIDALTEFMDEGRLSRGRSYRGDNRILAFSIKENVITASVRGNVNPYFGVYEEPLYKVRIELTKVAARQWSKIFRRISGNAGWVSRLLLGEMPEDIAVAFSGVKTPLLPRQENDFLTRCSCPDWSNPCKHIAGVCYRVASLLDNDPFLLFQLRGLSRERLQAELAKSPLGQALSSGLEDTKRPEPQPVAGYFTCTQQEAIPEKLTLREFWSGSGGKVISGTAPGRDDAFVSAIQVKKLGDWPAFWESDSSFIEVMESIYGQIRRKNKERL